MHRLITLAVFALVAVATSSQAAVLCTNRSGQGPIKVRLFCKLYEVQLDPVALDLKGPKGDTGETGPQGPQGITGPQGPMGELPPRTFVGRPSAAFGGVLSLIAITTDGRVWGLLSEQPPHWVGGIVSTPVDIAEVVSFDGEILVTTTGNIWIIGPDGWQHISSP